MFFIRSLTQPSPTGRGEKPVRLQTQTAELIDSNFSILRMAQASGLMAVEYSRSRSSSYSLCSRNKRLREADCSES